MISKKSKKNYYISSMGLEKILVIDEDSMSIINEINVGSRPYEIVVDEENNVYIATDRNCTVTIIDFKSKKSKKLYIPNNGNFKVDFSSKKIYACNTETISIYDLITGKLIENIKGFMAVDSIEIDKRRKRLYVLDVFENKINVYNTETLRLINSYKDLGDTPNHILLSDSGKYIYIANKGINKNGNRGSISILDIEGEIIDNISFKEGSSITYIEGYLNTLYVVNIGLKTIDFVDTINKKIIYSLKPSSQIPQRVKLSKDKDILLVTSINNIGQGSLDIVDLNSQKIIKTFNMNEKNTFPYDIGLVTEGVINKEILTSNIQDKWEEEGGCTILAKKLLSTYNEKIIFKKVVVEVDFTRYQKIEIESVRFEACNINENTKIFERIEGRVDYATFKFEFSIPYYIKAVTEERKRIFLKGFLKGKMKAVLYISSKYNSEDIEITLKSTTNLLRDPYIIDNYIYLDVSTTISVYAIIQELINVPTYE